MIKPILYNHALSRQAESQGLVSKAVGPAAVTAWKERQKSSSGEIWDDSWWDFMGFSAGWWLSLPLMFVGIIIPYGYIWMTIKAWNDQARIKNSGWLVVEPTPLKHDGVRPLGWWHFPLWDHNTEVIHDWLVVSTPLKNISQWDGLSHILWTNKIHVPNHKPEWNFDHEPHELPWIIMKFVGFTHDGNGNTKRVHGIRVNYHHSLAWNVGPCGYSMIPLPMIRGHSEVTKFAQNGI